MGSLPEREYTDAEREQMHRQTCPGCVSCLRAEITTLERQLAEAQAALRALSWQEPDGTRHWCEFAGARIADAASGVSDDCNCDEGRAILGESE